MSGTLRYRIQVYGSGVQSTTGSVAFTIGTSQLAGIPTMGGQRVSPLDGRVESLPWKFRVVDASSFFTKKISSTASGRLNLLGRLARFQASTNSTASSAYGTLQVGRVTDVALANPNVAMYEVTLSDERVIERNTMLFTKVPPANAVSLMPAGILGGFFGQPGAPPGQWKVNARYNNLVQLQYTAPSSRFPKSSVVQRLLLGDLAIGLSPQVAINTKAVHGNFTYLRWHGSTRASTAMDFEIASLDGPVGQTGTFPVFTFADTVKSHPPDWPFYVWVVWSTAKYGAQPAIGASPPFSQNTYLTGYLYMPNRPPDEDAPLFIGGNYGLSPAAMLASVYSNGYSTTLPVRYSTAAVNALKGSSYAYPCWWRITSPAQMDTWLEEQIYKPNLWVPLIDTQGRVSPTALSLRTTAATTSFLALTSTNLVAGKHPTFEQRSDQAVTRLAFTVPIFSAITWNLGSAGSLLNGNYNDIPPALVTQTEITVRASTVAGSSVMRSTNYLQVIGQELSLMMPGLTLAGFPSTQAVPVGLISQLPAANAGVRARPIFARFSDGPLWSRNVRCLASVDGTSRGKLQPGNYVRLALGTYPMPQRQSRGPSTASSGRIFQIMTRQEWPTGPQFELLDCGPEAVKTSTPSLAVAASTYSSQFGAVLSLSNATTGRWQIQVVRTTSTGASAPSQASTRWRTCAVGFGAAGTIKTTQVAFPSRTKLFFRADNQRAGHFVSAWSSAVSVVTAKITGPTSAKTTQISASQAVLKWKDGSSQFPTDVMAAQTTSAVLGTSRRVNSVPAATTTYFLVLAGTTGTKYKWGVRHIDPYGGYSTTLAATFTAGVTKTTCPPLAGRGIIILQGA